MNQTEAYKANGMTIGLYGYEKGSYKNLASTSEAENVVLDETHHIKVFPSKDTPLGKFSYPFSLMMPAWVPSSVIHHSEELEMQITYKVRAQFEPANPQHWADQDLKISHYRGEQVIWVQRPMPESLPPPPKMDFKLDLKIGGFFGIAGKQSITEVIFEKNNYQPGDKAVVTVKCDNTKCDKDVKSIKFKLKRKTFITTFGIGPMKGAVAYQHASTYIDLEKVDGCKGGAKTDHVLTVTIPETNLGEILEPKQDSKSKMIEESKESKPEHATHVPSARIAAELKDEATALIYKSITPSLETKLIKVQYSLKVFIKHDGWAEFGEGNAITMPIRVWKKETVAELSKPKLPEDWSPTVEETALFEEALETSDYHKEFIIPAEKKWYADLAMVVNEKNKNLAKTTVGKIK